MIIPIRSEDKLKKTGTRKFDREEDVKENCPINEQNPEKGNSSGVSDVEKSGREQKQSREEKILSREFRWISRAYKTEPTMETCSVAASSVDNNSSNSEIYTYSDRFSSTGSELSEMAIHTLLVETRARALDREAYQDPDSDRYVIPGERIFDNAADGLETIAVSKRSLSLLPQKGVIRTDLQPFEQETEPLAKIRCVKMEDDAYKPDELSSQLRVMKTYLKARY